MLLMTKLFRPRVPDNNVPRPRLLALLEDGATADLTLVAAPAGYGKTTLVAAWLAQQTSPPPVAWLSLDAHDDDPLRFWQYLLTGLNRARPTVAAAARQAAAAQQPPPLEVLVNTLINDIWEAYQQDEQQLILVLDDYHFITEPAIHDSLNQLLDYVPHQALRILITTRSDPPLKLARRRARRQLCEIRAADLRFTPAEIAALYQLEPDGGENDALVARLSARTEGWVAALQLLHMTRGAPAALPATGSGHLVADYLLEEVLQQQPAPVGEFLLKTAVVDAFSEPLAAFLLEQPAAEAAINHLRQHNLFLISLDDSRRWYRYHHLFADLLRAQAERQLPQGETVRLLRRAARWHAAEGMWPQAIDYALASGDAALAADHLLAFLEADPSWLFVRSQWLDALPGAVLDAQPTLHLVRAHLAFSDASGRGRERMAADLARARAALDALPERDPTAEAHYAYVAVMESLLNRNEAIAALRDRCLAAFQAAPEEALHARGRLAYWLGLLYGRLGQPAGMQQWLSAAQQLLLTANDVYVYTMAHVQAWQQQIEAGAATAQTLAMLEQFKRHAPLMAEGHPISGAVYLVEGTIYFYRGELEEATAALEQGVALIQLTSEYGMELTGLWNLAFVRYGMGDVAGALALAETLAERVPVFARRTDILRAWFTLPQYGTDRPVTAEMDRWLAQNREAMPALVADGRATDDFFALMQLFIFVRLLLRRDERAALPAALVLLTQQAAQMSAAAQWRRRLQVQLHRVLLLAALQRRAEALEALAAALAMAHADLHRYSFIEAAAEMIPLLEALQRRGDDSAWTADVLARCRRYAPAGASAPAEQPLAETLSARELEVVALLADGLTNKEIGRRLHLSPNTVRVHTSNIYGKLNVNGRVQAAARARELGLLA